jgi:hypothetical protein
MTTGLCQSIDTLAMTYLDDELADEELRDFELHLIGCAACRGRLDTERDSIAELRRRLAPPPTPDIVRARLIAALDTEDATVAASERRARATSWLLPGAASAVAVAALLVFVFARPSNDQKNHDPVSSVVGTPMQGLQVGDGTTPTSVGRGVGHVDIFRAASWEEQSDAGRTLTHQLYRITLPSGIEIPAQVVILDARGLDFDTGDRVLANGYELHVAPLRNGQYAVTYRAPDGVGYVFMAPELSPDDLIGIVSEHWIEQVGARMVK